MIGSDSLHLPYQFVLRISCFTGMPSMGGLGNAGGTGAMFTGAQEMEGQMGGGMGGPMANVIQGALGGGVPGMAQKRTKMGKVHKLLSKLSKRKEIKKHQHKN